MNSSNKIRILYIGPIPPEVGGHSAGGIAINAWQLATQANKRDYEVYILTNTTNSFIRDGIHVLRTPPRSKLLRLFLALKFYLTGGKGKINNLGSLSFKTKIYALSEADFLQKILGLVRPDIIHIHSAYNRLGLSLKVIGCSIPIVVTHHEFEPGAQRENNIRVSSQVLSITDYLICVSEHSRKQLDEFGLDYNGKLGVIYNPLDISNFPLLEREKLKQELELAGKKVAFFSGVHKPVEKKGLDVLLRTFAEDPYLSHNCCLVVKSNEEGTCYAQRFIERGEIDGRVLGLLPWGELVKYYNAADVFVMPSRAEGFGIVYAEALMAGTPVVGFHKTLKEIEDLLGIYIGEKFNASKEDENDLGNKIKKVLNTDFDRGLLRKKVIEKLSWEVKFPEFDAIYKEALGTLH